jgi:hypothetical protein
VKRKRIYSVPRRTEFILKCRGNFQQLLAKTIINVLESLIEHRTNPLLTQEYSTILTISKDADTKKLFWPEVFGDPTPASSLLTLVIPNLHSGANLLAMILYSHRDRFRDKDISTLGSILAQFEMLSNVDPSTFFVHCQKIRNTMPEPFPEVNYEAFGLIVQPGAHGEPARFTIVTDKSLVGIFMIQFDKRIAMTPSL